MSITDKTYKIKCEDKYLRIYENENDSDTHYGGTLIPNEFIKFNNIYYNTKLFTYIENNRLYPYNINIEEHTDKLLPIIKDYFIVQGVFINPNIIYAVSKTEIFTNINKHFYFRKHNELPIYNEKINLDKFIKKGDDVYINPENIMFIYNNRIYFMNSEYNVNSIIDIAYYKLDCEKIYNLIYLECIDAYVNKKILNTIKADAENIYLDKIKIPVKNALFTLGSALITK